MKTEFKIGCFVAVVILIGVSFTSVVGYNSITSDVKASPLFAVRSSRAIDEESKDLTCDYVGKGNRIIIPLPKRNNKVELLDRFTNIIRTMDDKSFDRLVELIIKHLHQRNDSHENDKEEIFQFLIQLRDNPNEITHYIMEGEESNPNTYECTWGWEGCPDYTLEYGGIIVCMLYYVLFILAFISVILQMPGFLPTILPIFRCS